ncbi:MAG: twin-arginine translocase subunit TatC [Gammaproteobacteria bacterium]
MSQSPDDPSASEAPFLSHLMELKDRLTRSVIAIIAVFIVFAPFAFQIFDTLVEPLTTHFPDKEALIAFKIVSPILTPYKLVLVLSVYVVMPYLLYQLWAFVAPGLYSHEKKMVFPLLVSSAVLYYVGMAFAYFVVLPLVFGFLTSVGPESMQYTPDIGEYLDFVLAVFLAFGLAFEVPIATILLIATGMADVESLKAKRPYVVIGAFVLGMFLTPPDVISQTLLAVPMWLLFEAGLFFSAMFVGKKEKEEPENNTIGTGAAAAGGGAGFAATGTGVAMNASDSETGVEDPEFGDTEEYREMTEEEMEAALDDMEDDEEDNDEPSDEKSADNGDDGDEDKKDAEEEEETPWHKQKHDDDYADEP